MKYINSTIKVAVLFLLLPIILLASATFLPYTDSKLLIPLFNLGYIVPAYIGFPLFASLKCNKRALIIVASIYAAFVTLCMAFERRFVLGMPDNIGEFWSIVAIRSIVSCVLIAFLVVLQLIDYGKGRALNKILFGVVTVAVIVCTVLQNAISDLAIKILPDFDGIEYSVLAVCSMVICWYSFAVGRGLSFNKNAKKLSVSIALAIVGCVIWALIVAGTCRLTMAVNYGAESLDTYIAKDYIVYTTIVSAVIVAIGSFIPELIKKPLAADKN